MSRVWTYRSTGGRWSDASANRNLADQTLRICQDGSVKLPQRLVRTLLYNLITHPPASQSKPLCHWAALGVAGWFVFLAGVDEEGRRCL